METVDGQEDQYDQVRRRSDPGFSGSERPTEERSSEEVGALREDHRNLTSVYRFVRSLGDYYTTVEAAEKLGVSKHTLRAYIARLNDKELSPSSFVNRGKMKIYLYTEEDIDRIRVARRARTRPVLKDGDKRLQRSRFHNQLYYWRTRIRRHELLEDEAQTKFAKAKVEDIKRRMDAL